MMFYTIFEKGDKKRDEKKKTKLWNKNDKNAQRSAWKINLVS